MDYLTQSRNHTIDLNTKYSTHLSSSTKFPQLIHKHNDFIQRNILEFYPSHNSITRSCTTLSPSQARGLYNAFPSTMSSFSKFEKSQSSKFDMQEMEGLKVPKIYPSSRNKLYTRYTVNDWLKSAQGIYGNSDGIRGLSEKIRGDSLRLSRAEDEKTKQNQSDSSKKLGDRIIDIDHSKSKLDIEIDEIIAETRRLELLKQVAEKALTETENPLHITQECLFNREKRAGIDLVHDIPEKELLKEISIIKSCQDKLAQAIQKADDQLRTNRNVQYELEKDSRDKYQALKIDLMARNMNNSSVGLVYLNGLEKFNNCTSTPESWLSHTKVNIERSFSARQSSTRLREEIELCLNQCQNDIWKQWVEVNRALSYRIQETTESRNRDQVHLKNILREIFDMEKNIEYLKKSIADKEAPLNVAKNRLSTRLSRPNVEKCDDIPRNKLAQEISEIENSIISLRNQLRMAESAFQTLLLNKADIESDLNVKINSLFIDREKCQGIRKTFSIPIPLKH